MRFEDEDRPVIPRLSRDSEAASDTTQHGADKHVVVESERTSVDTTRALLWREVAHRDLHAASVCRSRPGVAAGGPGFGAHAPRSDAELFGAVTLAC